MHSCVCMRTCVHKYILIAISLMIVLLNTFVEEGNILLA